MQLREATTIAEIADWAGRGEDSAREYVRWFETIGLVRRAADAPEQYETNKSCLYWRRVDRIRSPYRDTEIVERLQGALDELDEFSEHYDAASPGEVDIVRQPESGTSTSKTSGETSLAGKPPRPSEPPRRRTGPKTGPLPRQFGWELRRKLEEVVGVVVLIDGR